jgi:predicted nucleic acid-binding protein
LRYLLDTNALSEPKRKRPDPRAAAWLRGVDPADLYVSVLSLGEIANGIAKLGKKDAQAAAAFDEWARVIRADFASRILDVDLAVADVWGHISAPRSLQVVDALLAATALVHGMTLVTRNVRDIADTGVSILNPWSD